MMIAKHHDQKRVVFGSINFLLLALLLNRYLQRLYFIMVKFGVHFLTGMQWFTKSDAVTATEREWTFLHYVKHTAALEFSVKVYLPSGVEVGSVKVWIYTNEEYWRLTSIIPVMCPRLRKLSIRFHRKI